MTPRKRYRLILEDEARIENIVQYRGSLTKFIAWGLLIILSAVCLGILITAFTPLRTALPGYLNKDQRIASEVQYMRVDSLLNVMEDNRAFIDNIINIISPDEKVLLSENRIDNEVSKIQPDTLLTISPEEEEFIGNMREREKYNISVIAPLAAESLMFSPVNEESVISEDSKTSNKAEIILARDTHIGAIADGRVISIIRSTLAGGNSLIIQHPKGFISRYSRLGKIIVNDGEMVSGGDVIALSPIPHNGNRDAITLEMWHNGTPLIPYEYIGNEKYRPHIPIVDEDIGRGRL